MSDRQMKRSVALIIFSIDISTLIKKLLNYLLRTALHRQMQRRVAGAIFGIDRQTFLYHQL